MEPAIWERFHAKGWPEHLEGAARHFRCSSCRSSADVLLLPASREKAPPVPEDDEADDGGFIDLLRLSPDQLASRAVEAFFFHTRNNRKRDR